jgi:hypothetical protein
MQREPVAALAALAVDIAVVLERRQLVALAVVGAMWIADRRRK